MMTNLGGAPPVQVSLPPEHEAVLVALAVGEDKVHKLTNDIFGAGVHEVEGALVVGLGEGVGVGKLVEALSVHPHHDPAVGQEAVVQLVAAHILVFAVRHCCGRREEPPDRRGGGIGPKKDCDSTFAKRRHVRSGSV